MALGVLDHVRPGYTAVFIQIDFHLGQGQFQCAVAHAAPAQRTSQIPHKPQKRENFGPQFFSPGLQIVEKPVHLLVSQSLGAFDGRGVQFG